MAHENLTIRNLSSTEITVIRVSRIPQPTAPGPQPVTIKNITNIGNLTHNFTSFVAKTLPIPPPSRPSSKTIAESAQAFSEEDVSICLLAFGIVQTELKINKDEVVRLAFTVGEAKFRVNLNSHTPAVHCLSPGTEHRFNAVFHRNHGHLALLSSAALGGWMERLKNEIPLSLISIPGTHNTPTCYTALPSVRCQAVGPKQQLENGIRFFDIRCQVDGPNTLTLVHGAFPISLTGSKNLSEVLKDAYSFLDGNPHECIIISLKREGRGGADDAKFAKVLKEGYIDKEASRWHLEDNIPILGQVRGKAILFRRFALPGDIQQFGINAEHWDYNTPDSSTPSRTCRVQDFCEVLEPATIEKKVVYVKEHLERSAKPLEPDTTKQLFVNFLSASNFWKVGCWPEKIAEKVNVETKRHLAIDHVAGKAHGDGSTGVVVCDYVGEGGDWELVRLIVTMNGWIKKTG
ncbi:PLC-like phosphodiesterase [Tuber magnatum]|uniref:PLC-like phosphodiesterase n=1 Tax=Tuber magnatum TaxID=42249 RepID=A0A317SMH9_9PEZI|nr:PLC-like phosphodiesterase [Tuber magnatum]